MHQGQRDRDGIGYRRLHGLVRGEEDASLNAPISSSVRCCVEIPEAVLTCWQRSQDHTADALVEAAEEWRFATWRRRIGLDEIPALIPGLEGIEGVNQTVYCECSRRAGLRVLVRWPDSSKT